MSLFDEPAWDPAEIVEFLFESAEGYLDTLEGSRPCFWSQEDTQFFRRAKRERKTDPDSFRLGLLVGLAFGERDAGKAQQKKRSRKRPRTRWDLARRIWFAMSEEKRESVLAKEVWFPIHKKNPSIAGELDSFQKDWARHVEKWKAVPAQEAARIRVSSILQLSAGQD